MTSDTTSNLQVNKTVEKLAKICGMLGSIHDGERASAALLATQIIDDLDLTWHEIIMSAFASKKEPRTIDFDDHPAGWHTGYCKWLIINKADQLKKWDMDFLTNLAGKYARSRLTKKQADCFIRIAIQHGLEV